MKKIVGIFIVLTMIGMVIGLFYYNTGKNRNSDVSEVKGIVLETDDSDIIKGGVSKIGNAVSLCWRLLNSIDAFYD
jgi:hypothetical protein